MLRDMEVLANPVEKSDEQIIIKISSVDVPIKEIEGPIVLGNLDQFDAEKISRGIVVNDHKAHSSTSALENFQPTWCPSGLSRTQKRKLQRARCKKLKEEGLTKVGKEIFNKDPISLNQARKNQLPAQSRLS